MRSRIYADARNETAFQKTDKVQGFHFIQSFKPGEVTPEQAHQLGCEFIERCFANDYEVVIGTHTDRAHIHNHIIVNSVSFVDGHKYQSTPATFTNYAVSLMRFAKHMGYLLFRIQVSKPESIMRNGVRRKKTDLHFAVRSVRILM